VTIKPLGPEKVHLEGQPVEVLALPVEKLCNNLIVGFDVLTANQKCAKLLMDVMDELFEKDHAAPKFSCLAVNDPCKESCVEGKVFC
jgi:hypothetical protein